ncbi:MAG: O-antigen ligase family protein [Cyanobacteriota bacterium]|jgi:O-antigen ligase
MVGRFPPLPDRLDHHRPTGADPLGWRCFQLGLFLLPASALLGGLLLFVALIQGSRRAPPPLADPLNRPLALAALLMLLGAPLAYSGGLAWAGLGNWLPFFWAFWAYQPYLASPAARRRVALWLLAGSVPVIVSGLGQLWWGWRGPWQALGGLLIWHLAPGGRPAGRLAGLFDYANIAGAWLALVWPLALALLLEPARRQLRRWLVGLLLAAGVAVAVFLTGSRNAWGALVLALPPVLGRRTRRWLLPLLALGLLAVALASAPGVPEALQQPLRQLVPEPVWARLSDLQYADQRELASTRLAQWRTAVGLIGERPWLGWGAAAFGQIYPQRTGLWHGHPHNLPLDLALSHGLPVALLVVGLVLVLLLRSLGPALASPAPFERAWWTAALLLVLLHASDIPLYDSRINVAGWVLLAGLRQQR